MSDSLTDLRERTRAFAAARDWEQYHTPKNLAMALSVEVAELAENFQWLPTGRAGELAEGQHEAIRHELADVLLYLVQIADHGGVDLDAAVERKLGLNAIKHPPLHAPRA